MSHLDAQVPGWATRSDLEAGEVVHVHELDSPGIEVLDDGHAVRILPELSRVDDLALVGGRLVLTIGRPLILVEGMHLTAAAARELAALLLRLADVAESQ